MYNNFKNKLKIITKKLGIVVCIPYLYVVKEVN